MVKHRTWIGECRLIGHDSVDVGLNEAIKVAHGLEEGVVNTDYDWRQRYSVAVAEPVSEADLNRVLSHVQIGRPFGVVSAHQPECTTRENSQLASELGTLLRSFNYGYKRVIGHYLEDEPRHLAEESLIVSGEKAADEKNFKTILRNVGIRFGQDSVMIGSLDGEVRLISTMSADGNHQGRLLGPLTPTSLPSVYSAWRGWPYVVSATIDGYEALFRSAPGFFAGFSVQTNRQYMAMS